MHACMKKKSYVLSHVQVKQLYIVVIIRSRGAWDFSSSMQYKGIYNNGGHAWPYAHIN